MLQIDSSFIINGTQNVEWVVVLPGNNKETILLEVTFKTIIPLDIIVVDNVLHINFFPVSP